MSATKLIADQVRARTPGWEEDELHDGFMFVFGDPAADKPGRHIVCDGLTDHPIIIANVRGLRMTLELPRVSDAGDCRSVLAALEAIGALDPSDSTEHWVVGLAAGPGDPWTEPLTEAEKDWIAINGDPRKAVVKP